MWTTPLVLAVHVNSNHNLLGEMNLDDDDHDSWREEMASPV